MLTHQMFSKLFYITKILTLGELDGEMLKVSKEITQYSKAAGTQHTDITLLMG